MCSAEFENLLLSVPSYSHPFPPHEWRRLFPQKLGFCTAHGVFGRNMAIGKKRHGPKSKPPFYLDLFTRSQL